MCKSINEENKQKHDKIISLAKSELTSVEVLISMALIDWILIVLINHVLK